MCLFREAEQNKNEQVYFVLLSTFTIFDSGKSKIVGASELKNKQKFILYFSQLSLSLHAIISEKNDKAMANYLNDEIGRASCRERV